MKKFLFIIPIIFLFSCTQVNNASIVKTPTATVTITNISQDYFEYSNDYSYVDITYDIKNTGNVEINYYKIYFIVTCKDGTTYTDWNIGIDLSPNETQPGDLGIYTSWKQYSTVKVLSMQLDSY